MFDLCTLRNVNRPYTEKELEEMYKKDHSIQEEDKKSRLQRCVSFNDPDYDTIINKEKDANKKASSSFVEKDDMPPSHVGDTTLCDDHDSSNKPSMMMNTSIFYTSP